jgi:ParB-like chromosome segregation protein Spo0J
MAKRKRLTAPEPGSVSPVENMPAMHPNDIPVGIMPVPGRRAPIADVAGQASAVAALEKIAAELTSARAEGRMIQKLALETVACDYLARDRVALDAGEMDTLKASLRARGQQTPIEVVQTAPGHYGLISGFRRVQALRDLARTEGGVAEVLALVRQPGDAAHAYTAMVEENEIRVGLSYFERAHIVRSAVAAGVFPSEAEALKVLFASASRAKRSKIKSFLPVIEHLGSALTYPNALTERAGLALAARIAADPQFAPRLRDRLRKAQPELAEDESHLLTKALTDKTAAPAAVKKVQTPPPPALAADIEVSFSPGELRLTGAGVTQALADEINRLLARS